MLSDLDSRIAAGRERPDAPAPHPPAGPRAMRVTAVPRWREVLAAPAVALLTLAVALAATDAADIAFRDPDHVAAQYVAIMVLAVALLVGVDIVLRARRAGAAVREVRRTRWTWQRLASAALALASFYLAYLAYRNLKGALPLLRPGVLFDVQLADADRALFGGHDPAALLHSALGTGVVATHALSTVYAAFIVFLPLSLAVALVFARDLATSLYFATALSLNWLIGIGSYYLLPSLGPVYAEPGPFATLPRSEVTRLQELLLDDRIGFLRDPATGTPQAIAAFASLHIAMSFTALAAAHLLDLGRRLKIALWIWLLGTVVATVYFGWHYVVDDVAGIAMGALSLVLARALMGYDVRAARAGVPA